MPYASKLNAIVARLCTDVAAAAGVDASQVHSGRRDLQSAATWQALGWDPVYSAPSGWYVDRVSGSSVSAGLESTTAHLRIEAHDLEIVGWLAVQDPQTGQVGTTSAAWRKRVEDVRTAIREDLYTSLPLGGAAVGGDAPIVVVDEHREIRGVLCHYVEISMTAHERIAWS